MSIIILKSSNLSFKIKNDFLFLVFGLLHLFNFFICLFYLWTKLIFLKFHDLHKLLLGFELLTYSLKFIL